MDSGFQFGPKAIAAPSQLKQMSPPTHMAPAITPSRLAAGPAIRW